MLDYGICVAVFLIGIAIGYSARTVISLRRRAEARRRYDTTGS
jgi:hypothetical protein